MQYIVAVDRGGEYRVIDTQTGGLPAVVAVFYGAAVAQAFVNAMNGV